MTNEQSTAGHLLNHCKSCRSPCCEDHRFVVSETEYVRALQSGMPDYFVQITVCDTNVYMLDFVESVCPYSNTVNKVCGIEHYKMEICKAYPVVGRNNIAQHCAAKHQITVAYKERAQKHLARMIELVPNDINNATQLAYEARHDRQKLREMGATITYPPTLKPSV
jgi:Fe-S-cluster containining protein